MGDWSSPLIEKHRSVQCRNPKGQGLKQEHGGRYQFRSYMNLAICGTNAPQIVLIMRTPPDCMVVPVWSSQDPQMKPVMSWICMIAPDLMRRRVQMQLGVTRKTYAMDVLD